MGGLEGGLALLVSDTPPCVLFEDEHLLVVNKPAGMNTHAPAPFAGEGIYDWLRHREPRWSSLAIIHRLDKETSGVLVFSKTALANRALTSQFTERSVHKKYLLLTDRPVASRAFTAQSSVVRAGARYVSRPKSLESRPAETRFRVLRDLAKGRTLVQAEPVTGRTHQVRVHASEHGFPILGDTLYDGSPWQRVCLHAAEIALTHPSTGSETVFTAPPDFSLAAGTALREALIPLNLTDAFRLLHGAADGCPKWYVDRLGNYLLSSSENAEPSGSKIVGEIDSWMRRYSIAGSYHKTLRRNPGHAGAEASPRHVLGQRAPDPFVIRESGIQFGLSFNEGYSIGLFLDQRDNRRRLLTGHVAADFPLVQPTPDAPQVLNTFAYTCAFSVCAAAAGAVTTSLDLSKRYLDWGRRNFELNGLDPAGHDFIFGDAFDWMQRLAKKKRMFDLVILDPPTFSRSKEHGSFQVDKDYPRLVHLALPLLKPNGVLFASTNAAALKPDVFLQVLNDTILGAGRRIVQRHYAPQPPDFPVHRDEPAYLKTVWMRLAPAVRLHAKRP